ncbi:MAG: prepilin-type N-terminal cleavage/methylation domain-containing protein [Planctomycetes bacterium]|nr:prepilin-type N-terminal cleavage/methylation domain-containing protein [Planctomycetota bacterium]
MVTTKHTGMSLTELLVVIGIIGILASILTPAIKSVQVKAKSAACRAEIRDIERACRGFQEDFGFYPPDSFGTSQNTYITSWGARGYRPLAPLLKGCPARSDILYTSDDVAGPENSSICMVFFLGSQFIIGGKAYGPYCDFKKEQLVPNPDAADWNAKRYPARGQATGTPWRVYGSYGQRGTTRTPIPWEIHGVDDDNPGTDVRLFQYLDKFGPPRSGNPRYFDYYVYDCNDPEGWHIYGPEPQPPIHNLKFIDISCYGFDGYTSVNVAEGDDSNGGGGPDDQGEDDDVSGKRGKELRGMWKDDINNWTETNAWPYRNR